MRNCRIFLMVVIANIFLQTQPTAFAQSQLNLGFFAPELPINPYQRFEYAQSCARHLMSGIGIPVVGAAYKSTKDFHSDIKIKKIHLAVIGGFSLSSYGSGKILASSIPSTSYRPAWTIYAKQKIKLAALRNRVFQIPTLGPGMHSLIENGILGGNFNLKAHFKISESPDFPSALEAVRLGRAQLIFAPSGINDLYPVLDNHIMVPTPALVVVDKNLSPEIIKKVTKVFLTFKGPGGPIVGWKTPSSGDYANFAAVTKPKKGMMDMVSPGSDPVRSTSLINAQTFNFELPELDEYYKVP